MTSQKKTKKILKNELNQANCSLGTDAITDSGAATAAVLAIKQLSVGANATNHTHTHTKIHV